MGAKTNQPSFQSNEWKHLDLDLDLDLQSQVIIQCARMF